MIDDGPSCSEENEAGGPVIAASYSMCETCTGYPTYLFSSLLLINLIY